MMRFLLPALAVGLIASGQARGGTVFTLPGTLQGKAASTAPQAFTSSAGGFIMYATGSESSLDLKKDALELGDSARLHGKIDGPGETGLGINGIADDDIGTKLTIEIDLGRFYSASFGPVTLEIGSVQKGEGYALFGGKNGPSDLLHAFTEDSSNVVATSYLVSESEMLGEGSKLYLTASSGNVVHESATVASVPEPGTAMLLVPGMATIGGLGWARRRKVA